MAIYSPRRRTLSSLAFSFSFKTNCSCPHCLASFRPRAEKSTAPSPIGTDFRLMYTVLSTASVDKVIRRIRAVCDLGSQAAAKWQRAFVPETGCVVAAGAPAQRQGRHRHGIISCTRRPQREDRVPRLHHPNHNRCRRRHPQHLSESCNRRPCHAAIRPKRDPLC